MKIRTKLNISHETLTHGNDTNLTRDSNTGLTRCNETVTCYNADYTWTTFLKLKEKVKKNTK